MNKKRSEKAIIKKYIRDWIFLVSARLASKGNVRGQVSDLSKKYGVHRSTIRKVRDGLCWGEVH